MIIPPFAGVMLVEYRDRIELTPVYWFRENIGLGGRKASEIESQTGAGFVERMSTEGIVGTSKPRFCGL
jgi:hypothetical protein